jgi:poly-beta-1,6-N-acetyl-D-glucosamine N-deacetylase
MPLNEFKSHMYSLKEAGYSTVTINDLHKFMRGEKELPEKSFVLTFDDGIKSTYYYADPVLAALNYNAVMFVITNYSVHGDNRYYLNKEELIEMHKSGRWDIESHSFAGHDRHVINQDGKTGPYLGNKLWLAEEKRIETNAEYQKRIAYDLQKSKEDIEQLLNKSVIGFALPFGDFAQRESNYPEANAVLLSEMQKRYSMVFYQFKPTVNKDYRANYNNKKEDFYLVMRVSAESKDSAEDLLEVIDAAEAMETHYIENSQQ